ncbi:MAG: hypothetical protein H6510_01150 [Acidobacteria bacterium]|nr:hypothetical protein [Acidobacteriota bacterium]MCB9396396.1 hypothetical protein [Acidobacteriota bacterium]
MGRWGAEEKKTQNIFGCLFAVLVLGVFIAAFLQWYPIQEGRKEFEEKCQELATGAHRRSDRDVANDLLEYAKRKGLPITQDNLKVEKKQDQNNISWIYIDTEYTQELNLFVAKYPIHLTVHKEVRLIQF